MLRSQLLLRQLGIPCHQGRLQLGQLLVSHHQPVAWLQVLAHQPVVRLLALAYPLNHWHFLWQSSFFPNPSYQTYQGQEAVV